MLSIAEVLFCITTLDRINKLEKVQIIGRAEGFSVYVGSTDPIKIDNAVELHKWLNTVQVELFEPAQPVGA